MDCGVGLDVCGMKIKWQVELFYLLGGKEGVNEEKRIKLQVWRGVGRVDGVVLCGDVWTG